MVGITKANFEDVFPTVETAIRKAEFIGIKKDMSHREIARSNEKEHFKHETYSTK